MAKNTLTEMICSDTKTFELAATLDRSVGETVGAICFLRVWVTQNKPNGVVLIDDAQVLPTITYLTGFDGESIYKSLRSVGILDSNGKLFDWDKYEGKALRARAKDRERKRIERGKLRSDSAISCPMDSASSMDTASVLWTQGEGNCNPLSDGHGESGLSYGHDELSYGQQLFGTPVTCPMDTENASWSFQGVSSEPQKPVNPERSDEEWDELFYYIGARLVWNDETQEFERAPILPPPSVGQGLRSHGDAFTGLASLAVEGEASRTRVCADAHGIVNYNIALNNTEYLIQDGDGINNHPASKEDTIQTENEYKDGLEYIYPSPSLSVDVKTELEYIIPRMGARARLGKEHSEETRSQFLSTPMTAAYKHMPVDVFAGIYPVTARLKASIHTNGITHSRLECADYSEADSAYQGFLGAREIQAHGRASPTGGNKPSGPGEYSRLQ